MTSRLSVRARFTLLYSIALIITVLLVSGGIYFSVQQALMGQIENHLRKDFSTINEYLKHDLNSLKKVADHGPVMLFRVLDGSQSVAVSNEWIRDDLEQIISVEKKESIFSVSAKNGRRYRVLIDTARPANTVYRIAVAHSEESVYQTRRTLALIILLIMPLAVATSLAIGYLIAGRVLAPIRAITRKAEEISAENLSERLPTGEGDDEISRLASVFNQTFARIEDSFARLRSFTADASHELRTPLAAIRSIGEAALQLPEERTDCREAIGSILEESDRLRQLVDALLVLSRADSNDIELRREVVDLGELTRETVDFLNVLAEEKHQTITLNFKEDVHVNVDRSSVRQALTNLLDNAIKYAPAESNIGINVGNRSGNEVFVEISDYGSGIPEEAIDQIFERFYRVDKGRSRECGGAGLGLSISKWAVESNGGRIEVESIINQGSLFRVIFPKQSLCV